MPPVRWKLALAVVAICLVHISSSAKATGRELAEEGWKPIVGYGDEISKYRNPGGGNLETTKVEKRPSTSEPIPPPQPPPPKPTAITLNNHQHGPARHKMKVPSHTKHQQHFHYGHGPPQIPMNLITHRSQSKPYKMPSSIMGGKATSFNGKRPMKPTRLQQAPPAHGGNREQDVFVAAPSTAIGSYAYFAQAPSSSLKTRLPPNPQQTHGHFDFGNRFAPSEDFFQFQRLPVQQQYVFPKYPTANDVHYAFQAQNDEYTRNLVPPLPSPQKFLPNKQKQKQQEQPVTEQVQVTKPLVEQMQTSLIPENILVQVPPPYQQHQTYYVTSQNDHPVDVQVTKEKLNVFHNNIPSTNNYNFQNEFAQFGRYQFEKKPSEAPKPPTYEVTEGKVWQQTPEFRFQYLSDPAGTRRPQIVQSQVEKVVEFLPTPIKPEGSLPTSATQSEISTVYSEVSKINRQKEAAQGDPSFFTVKEVSTHYPILGLPDFKQQFNLQISTPANQDNSEYSNEITTISAAKQEVSTETPTVTPTPVTIPSRDSWQQKRRPGHRRRKPIRPATPEEVDVETTTPPRERAPARRRPSRYRTTEATPVNEDRERPVRIRQRQRPRPTEEIPHNHRLTTEYYRGSHKNYEGQYQRTPERGFNKFGKYDVISEEEKEEEEEEEEQRPIQSRRPPAKYRIQQESEEIQSSETFSEEQQKYMIEEVTQEESTEERPTTDQIATTNIHTPENNEIDYSTINPAQATITIEEIHTQTSERAEETTTAPTTTTTTPTTTTAEATTTKSNRLRRPINYKSSPRPRFSVKEYRQRLNQYTSTSTTEASSRPSTEATARIRFPHRSRKPIMRYPQEAATEEEVTDPPRTKFVPKSPRYSSSTTAEPKIEEDDEAEKVVRTNSRVRPFGRTRSTTEATTTTQKVAIKPNIFSNLRRPPQVSLRNRIFNRYNRNSTTSSTTTESDPEVGENLENETSEVVEVESQSETSTEEEITTAKALTTTSAPDVEDELETTGGDVLKNEAVMQSQRVSDLTSSAQNDYNTPGIFKSVSSNVRRVPSYFTIATDDPILPIEAFFTNINKEKDKH